MALNQPWSAAWPLTAASTTHLTDYNVITELWEAMYERGWMFTSDYHPWPDERAQIWSSGTITALVDNGDGTWTLTDSSLAPVPSGGTDDGSWWNGVQRNASDCGAGAQYWVGLNCPNTPYLNGSYDVIIEWDDGSASKHRTMKPYYAIRGNIVQNRDKTLTFNLAGGTIENFVTAKFIPSSASLVGKQYYVIRTGRPWWGDINAHFSRYPDTPNDGRKWRGIVEVGKFYSDGTGYLKETNNQYNPDPYNTDVLPRNSWNKDKWKNKNVMVFGDESPSAILHRLTPTSNINNTIFFGARTAIPTPTEEAGLTISYHMTGSFDIVEANARCWPGLDNWTPMIFYMGYFKSYYSHTPRWDGSDALLPTMPSIIAGDTYTYYFGGDISAACGSDDPITGTRVDVDSMDNDIHTNYQNFCTPADFFPAPQIHKSFRMLQVKIESMYQGCTRPVNYTGLSEIPNYALARGFYDCSINAGLTSTSKTTVAVGPNTDSTYYFNVAARYYNKTLWVEVLRSSDGVRQTSSVFTQATADGTGKVVVYDATTDSIGTAINDTNWLGATVYYSAGWSRVPRSLFTRMHPVGMRWIPDIQTDDLGNKSPILPPHILDFAGMGSSGLGHWEAVIPASTGYKVYDDRGVASDGGGGNFEADKLIYFDGDQFTDPGATDAVVAGADDGTLKYYDRAYASTHKKSIQIRLNGETAGVVTQGGKSSITDNTKNWYLDWFGGGILLTVSLTADAGSTTTLQTDATYGDTSNANSAYFDPSLFPTSAPYVDFILEVDKTETGSTGPVTVTYKLPITNCTLSGTKQVLHFAAVDQVYGGGTMTVAGGDAARIKWPDSIVSRWLGRRVEFKKSDGTAVTVDCTHSDDNSLFFDALTTGIPAGSTYKIVNYLPGGVWKFQTTEPTTVEKSKYAWQKLDMAKYLLQPYGTDPRTDPTSGSAPEFFLEMWKNQENIMPAQFGRMRKSDQIWYGMYNEAYLMIKRLKHTKKVPGWNDPDSSENNRFVFGHTSERFDYPDTSPYFYPNHDNNAAWSAMLAARHSQWDAGISKVIGNSNVAPSATKSSSSNETDVSGTPIGTNRSGVVFDSSASAGYNYLYLTDCPTRLKSAFDGYGWGKVDEVDSTPGETAFPDKSKTAFNPQGISLIWHQWSLIGTIPASDTDIRQGTDAIGPTSAVGVYPSWTQPVDPVGHSTISGGAVTQYAASSVQEGFAVDVDGILKYDVVGGLAKV